MSNSQPKAPKSRGQKSCSHCGAHLVVIKYRWLIWILLWFVGGYIMYHGKLSDSQLAYDNGDRSAFAWRGFIFFLWPYFLVRPGVVIGPIAAFLELVIWLRNKYT